jgi:UDP-N-acetylglucosamine acyltransferase
VIDKRAEVHASAMVADDVSIGPWTVIGEGVEIGSGTTIGSHVVIKGPTRIGKNNKIYSFASLGDDPQDITYNQQRTELVIGDNNIIREYCMISRGTAKGESITKIGDDNFFMGHTHIGHDCQVGSNVVMTNYSALSGHVVLNDYCIISAYSGVHQFCQVGEFSFIARGTHVTKDVLPFIMIAGHTASACGLNTVGLKRRGFSSESVDNLRRAYRIIFRKGLTVQQSLDELEPLVNACPEVGQMKKALRESTRGIVR